MVEAHNVADASSDFNALIAQRNARRAHSSDSSSSQ